MWREHPLPNEAYHHCVIGKLHQFVITVFSHAVAGIEGVKQGTEDRALRGSEVEGACRGGVVSMLTTWERPVQKIQDPVTNIGRQP